MIHLFTGLPTRSQRDRQALALGPIGQRAGFGAVSLYFIDKGERIPRVTLDPNDLIVYDTTWASHGTFKEIQRLAKAVGVPMIAGRFTPGRIAHDVTQLLGRRTARAA